MTNYANWYAYYRTRMQMMKTAAGIAFSNVDDKYRVGYYSINNATGGDFLNVGAFTGTQKYNWYSVLRGDPLGATPLRTGLANIGRMYAGKLSTLNTVSVVSRSSIPASRTSAFCPRTVTGMTPPTRCRSTVPP